MYAFIHIPKTAGSTLRAILRRSLGHRHCDLRPWAFQRKSHGWLCADDLRFARRIYPRLDGIGGHRVNCFSGLEQAADLRFFTWVRDPVTRFVSLFLYSKRRRIERCTREEMITFCAKPFHRNQQTLWLSGTDRAAAAVEMLEKRIGFVGMMEAFDESLVLLQRWMAHPALVITYARRNAGRGAVAWPLLDDPELRGLIEAANREDRVVYEHVKNVVFPRQKAAFGPTLAEEVAALRHNNRTFVEPPEPLWSQVKRNWIYRPLLHCRFP